VSETNLVLVLPYGTTFTAGTDLPPGVASNDGMGGASFWQLSVDGSKQ